MNREYNLNEIQSTLSIFMCFIICYIIYHILPKHCNITAGNNEPQKGDIPIIEMDSMELSLWGTSIQLVYQYVFVFLDETCSYVAIKLCFRS